MLNPASRSCCYTFDWTTQCIQSLARLASTAQAINTITAPSVGTVTSKGEFRADVTMTDANATLSPNTLNGGAMVDAVLQAASNVKTVTAGRMERSSVLVGVNGDADVLPTTASRFAKQATLSSVSITSKDKTQPAYVDSVVAAWPVGKASLGLVQANNGDAVFGVAGHTIKTMAASVPVPNAPAKKLKLPKNPGTLPQLVIDEDDFHVQFVN